MFGENTKHKFLIFLIISSLVKIQWIQATVKNRSGSRISGYTSRAPYCHPPCENGGLCLVHNQCSCTKDYRGSRCQYPVSLCDSSYLRRNNVIPECKHLSAFTDCYLTCPEGTTLNPPDTSWIRCTVDGMWNPPTPPKCVREIDLCDVRRIPVNMPRHCRLRDGMWTCKISCSRGYHFSDGLVQKEITCSAAVGIWSPVGIFEDCKSPYIVNEQVISSNEVSSRYQNAPYIVTEQDRCPKFDPPTRGRKLCSMHNVKWTCTLSCQNGYQFPDGSTEQKVSCNVNLGVWSPARIFEYCTRVTREEKVNAFMQESPKRNHTSHREREDYTSSNLSRPRSDTQPRVLCKSPSAPAHGTIRCHQNPSVLQCSASCNPGYSFDHGFRELSLMCVKLSGEWNPDDQFPDCKRVCECLNGGKCVANSCVCPSGFRGNRCQYHVSLCAPKSHLESVMYSCQNRREESSCHVSCPRGKTLLPSQYREYRCLSNGTWVPNVKPLCLPDHSDNAIRPQHSNRQYPSSGREINKNPPRASQRDNDRKRVERNELISHRQSFVRNKV